GMLRSIHYRPMMERIFQRFDLPKGLVVLAAVESEFNPRARSAAGAAGIWQFMRSTGRDYDLVSRHHDYRHNPLRSTEAAARLLQSNYARLHSWPLAITAYDYGAGAMMNAAQAFDGNYLRILKDDDDPNLGFAVENYYSEFLAALKIYRNPDRYFPGIEPSKSPLLVATRYKVRGGDSLSRIARHYGVTVASLINENSISNPRGLRAGQMLSIPAGNATRHVRARARRYALRRGDTLYDIARRSGASVKALLEANSIDDPRALTIGQVIYIPGT
ncbi:MAG: lytic transglycosylase, partial [Candidatus Binataceae bacterium]